MMKRLSKIQISLLVLLAGGVGGYLYHKYHFPVRQLIPEIQLHSLKEQINVAQLPKHVAIMMDGNGRWATRQGQPRVFGHMNALQSVEEAITACIEIGIPYLTLYAFSTENWQRPKEEIDALMQLLKNTIRDKLSAFMENNIKLQVIGNISRLPAECRVELTKAVRATKKNTGLHLIVALSYSGKWDIMQAVQTITKDVASGHVQPHGVNAKLFQQYLSTKSIPDPDLLIRTGGDIRISNFMLWQLAYTELLILEKYWPDFRKADFYQAIITYQQRERRFGKIDSKF